MKFPVGVLIKRPGYTRDDHLYYHDIEKVKARDLGYKQPCPVTAPHSHIDTHTHVAQFANVRWGDRKYPTFSFLLTITPDDYARQLIAPVRLGSIWVYREMAYLVENNVSSDEDIAVAIRHQVMREDRRYQKMKRELDAFDRLESLASTSEREQIPEAIRLFVWQRDGGKCVRCGAREKLEFDHIIPVADGGNSTERNVQLLCEPCNRSKGRSVS